MRRGRGILGRLEATWTSMTFKTPKTRQHSNALNNYWSVVLDAINWGIPLTPHYLNPFIQLGVATDIRDYRQDCEHFHHLFRKSPLRETSPVAKPFLHGGIED